MFCYCVILKMRIVDSVKGGSALPGIGGVRYDDYLSSFDIDDSVQWIDSHDSFYKK